MKDEYFELRVSIQEGIMLESIIKQFKAEFGIVMSDEFHDQLALFRNKLAAKLEGLR